MFKKVNVDGKSAFKAVLGAIERDHEDEEPMEEPKPEVDEADEYDPTKDHDEGDRKSVV